MDNVTTYNKDGSHAKIAKRTLDEMKENLKKYSSIFEKYFGEQYPESNYGYTAPKTAADQRRGKVRQLKCGMFRDIFDLAREKNYTNLNESCRLLEENSNDYSFFDLKILIFIYLAFSSIGKHEIMAADDVYKKCVRPLFKENDKVDSFYPPFFMMMFLWPIQGVPSERKDRYDLNYYIEELNKRGGRWSTNNTP